ncbi:MAG: hypothetical protein ACE5I5_16290 [Candidatus Heimdallarchaeota archaeon]
MDELSEKERDLLQTVQKLGEALKASDLVVTWAKKITEKACEFSMHIRKRKASIPAAALYIASCLGRQYFTQKKISKSANLAAVTIRKHAMKLWDSFFFDYRYNYGKLFCKKHGEFLVPSLDDPTYFICPECNPLQTPSFIKEEMRQEKERRQQREEEERREELEKKEKTQRRREILIVDLAEQLDLPDHIIESALEIVRKPEITQVYNRSIGANRETNVSAGIIYLTSLLGDVPMTQEKIANALDISKGSIYTQYHNVAVVLFKYYEEIPRDLQWRFKFCRRRFQ